LIASCSSHVLWNLKTFVCIFLCMTLLVSIMLGSSLIVHDNLINSKSPPKNSLQNSTHNLNFEIYLQIFILCDMYFFLTQMYFICSSL
jgi:hypothetical protein